MGQLIEGSWSDEDLLSEIEKDGAYKKKPSLFRERISSDGSSGLPAATNRYHLYAAISCPWAHRTVLMRTLKELDQVITLTLVEQNPEGGGWWFAGQPHTIPGTDQQVEYLHQIYSLGSSEYTGRVTVPIIWDGENQKIVCNESSEIIRMFNSEFAELAPATPDYYPSDLRDEIDATNSMVLKGVNDAINGCGRGYGQAAYEVSFELLFSTLDQLEARLGEQRYLCGKRQTEADWRLFPSLVRFDAIYYIGYKCNRQRLEEYPNLSNYLRDLYQSPRIAETVDIELNKRLVYGPGGPIASNGIVPKGPVLRFTRPHDRDRFAKAA